MDVFKAGRRNTEGSRRVNRAMYRLCRTSVGGGCGDDRGQGRDGGPSALAT